MTSGGYETGERRLETRKRPSFEPAITRINTDMEGEEVAGGEFESGKRRLETGKSFEPPITRINTDAEGEEVAGCGWREHADVFFDRAEVKWRKTAESSS